MTQPSSFDLGEVKTNASVNHHADARYHRKVTYVAELVSMILVLFHFDGVVLLPSLRYDI